MRKLLALLLFALAPIAHAATVANTAYAEGSSGTITLSLTVANAGDLIVIWVTSGSSGSHYVSSITDTVGSSLETSLYGTFGGTSSLFSGGSSSYTTSAFYGYAAAAGSDTITITYSGSASSQFGWAADCSGVASSSELISSIVNYQASASGTNGISVSGGSGSTTVGSVPALVVGWASSVPSGTSIDWTAGTSPNTWTKAFPTVANEGAIEYLTLSTAGTVVETWTPSAAVNAFSWQVALYTGSPAPPKVVISNGHVLRSGNAIVN